MVYFLDITIIYIAIKHVLSIFTLWWYDMLIRHVVLRRYITLYSCDTQGCIAATAGIKDKGWYVYHIENKWEYGGNG